MREVPVTQARIELADLVNRVAYTGERVALTRHGRPLAGLVPVDDLRRLESADAPGRIGFTPPEPSGPDRPDQPVKRRPHEAIAREHHHPTGDER